MRVSTTLCTCQETVVFVSDKEHPSITFRAESDNFRRVTFLFKIAFKAGPYAYSPVVFSSYLQNSYSFLFTFLAPEQGQSPRFWQRISRSTVWITCTTNKAS